MTAQPAVAGAIVGIRSEAEADALPAVADLQLEPDELRDSRLQHPDEQRGADEDERLGLQPVPPERERIEQQPHEHDAERREPDSVNAPAHCEGDRSAAG